MEIIRLSVYRDRFNGSFRKFLIPFRNTTYLPWPENSPIDSPESSLPNHILITERTGCLFHLLKREDQRAIAFLGGLRSFVFKLPEFNGPVGPWKFDKLSSICFEEERVMKVENEREYKGRHVQGTCFSCACSRLTPTQMAWLPLSRISTYLSEDRNVSSW